MENYIENYNDKKIEILAGMERTAHSLNGITHRTDGPAISMRHANGVLHYEEYWLNGKRHRLDGPAEILYHPDGELREITYYQQNQIHKADGPASVSYYESGQIESNFYYQYGHPNRLDGPAKIYYHKSGEIKKQRFYLSGHEYSEEEFYKQLSSINKNNINTLIEKLETELKEAQQNVQTIEENLAACRKVRDLLKTKI